MYEHVSSLSLREGFYEKNEKRNNDDKKKKKKSESLSLVKKFFTNFESFDNEMLGGREIIKAKALFIHGGHMQLYPGYNWADIDDTVSD